MNDFRLYNLPVSVKQLLTAFLLTASIGFVLGAFFVRHTTRLEPAGIAERYKGTEQMGITLDDLPPGREIQYKKTRTDILTITHTHILALSMLFLLTGTLFAFTKSLTGWIKTAVLIEPFVSIIVTFGGMWLLVEGPPWWSYIIGLSGVLMSGCFAVMVLTTLVELWRSPEISAK